MSNQRLISVIIPCYNLGEFLSPCLESIAKQQDNDVEYIFVDDGSNDGTGTSLDLFCSQKLNARVIHQPNQGVSAARNTALAECAGEYVYLLDGDDILIEDAIEAMKKAIIARPDLLMSPVAVLKNGVKKVLSLSIVSGEYGPGEFYNKIDIFPTMPKLLYRREVIRRNHLKFDPTISVGEVYEFTIRFLSHAKRIAVVPDVFFYYVMRNSSATHHPNFAKDITVVETLERYYSEGSEFAQYPSFDTTAFKMLMSFTYNKYAKLHLKGNDVWGTLGWLLDRSIVKHCVDRVARCSDSPLKERLLALYVKYTGLKGYKLLSKII